MAPGCSILEVFEDRLDGALSDQVQWVPSLPTAGAWSEMIFKPNHPVVLGSPWIKAKIPLTSQIITALSQQPQTQSQ